MVKVNAVERLRAELARPSWSGDHIAMGTNTDPYQPAEGRYRLTRGVAETLGEAGNEYSILTKSTMVLRDLDVLEDHAQRGLVRVNLSIGTLEEDVWHMSEPGTPPPARRVEAVARLNEAGVPCGVLLAPVLPGLSDGDAALERTVRACLDAGALSISPILLHLRPGVRELFMPWLERVRPISCPATRSCIAAPAATPPRPSSKPCSARVRDIADRARGHVVSAGRARGIDAPGG